MKSLAILLFFLAVAIGCGAKSRPSEVQHEIGTPREWAPTCEWQGSAFPSKGDCDDGDMTLFAGLLCLSGEALACEMVKASQDANGRFWRSPRRVGADTPNSFSRDMGLGVLAYLVATKDIQTAERWQAYFKDAGYLCPDASDSRCDYSTPGFLATLSRVYRFLGLSPIAKSESAETYGNIVSLGQAQFSPPGYELHVVGVGVFIQRQAGFKSIDLDRIASTLARRQSRNGFFAYLNGDRPNYGCPDNESKSQWQFERADTEPAYEESMGWDCIFLENLMNKGATP